MTNRNPLAVQLGEPHDAVRANLIGLRKQARITRAQLSSNLQEGPDCIRDLEAGRKGATLALATKIAAYFETTIDQLVTPTTPTGDPT